MTTLQRLDGPRTTYPVVLGRGARRRFDSELRALEEVPATAGLLPVAGGGIDVDGHPYVARAVAGLPPLESLGRRVRDRGRPLEVGEAVAAVGSALGGLAALHAAGLVHAGVRPDVILRPVAPPAPGGPAGPEGAPGPPAVLADPVPPVVAAQVGHPGPAFAAPEVLQGGPPTAAGDVYAAAASLVHLATGRGPWTDGGADAEEVLLAIMSGEPPAIGVLAAHPGVAAATVRALAADPAARPDAAGLARALSGDRPGQASGGTGGTGATGGNDRLDTVAPFGLDVPVAGGMAVGDGAVTGGATTPAGGPAATGIPLGSRYLLHEELGRGSAGTVHRATLRPGSTLPRSPGGGRGGGDAGGRGPEAVPTEVAVKVLREELADDPTTVERFLAERRTLLGITHPNLVRVHDLVVEGSTMAIVMDLVNGPDLRRWMRTAPPLPPAAVCRLLAQLAGALDAVHAAGVVHRDLKPENVLLARVGTADLQVRLTDFGIARSVRMAAARLTQHGQVVGTPAYLAPEVTTGDQVGPPADVYALGVLAYELLAGCRPFAEDAPVALAHAHATLAPGRPPGLDDRLWRIVASCLAKDPAARPPAGALATALADCAAAVADAPAVPRLVRPPAPVPHPGAAVPAIPPDPAGPVLPGTPPTLPAPPGPVAPGGPGAPATAPASADAPDATTHPGHSHDHLATEAGTAPPPTRPPAGEPRPDRRRLYLLGAGVAVAALVAGGVAGVLTAQRDGGEREAPPALRAHPVYLETRGERADPETVVLRFDPHPGAAYHRVIRDPAAPGGQVDMGHRIAAGASVARIEDTRSDQPHCYVVQAIVLEEPSSSTTTTSRPLFIDPYQLCPDGEPAPSGP